MVNWRWIVAGLNVIDIDRLHNSVGLFIRLHKASAVAQLRGTHPQALLRIALRINGSAASAGSQREWLDMVGKQVRCCVIVQGIAQVPSFNALHVSNARLVVEVFAVRRYFKLIGVDILKLASRLGAHELAVTR